MKKIVLKKRIGASPLYLVVEGDKIIDYGSFTTLQKKYKCQFDKDDHSFDEN